MSVSHLFEGPTLREEAAHYAAAAVLVALVGCGGLAAASRIGTEPSAASDVVEAAIIIDLPPELASSDPKREVADGIEQQASVASTATSAPPPVDAPKVVDAPQPPDPTPLDVPPPPPAPDPAAVLEDKKVEASPPQAAAAPPAPQQEARAPTGSDRPAPTTDARGADDRPHASARALSAWQRSMASRLETAKRAMGHRTGREGTVVVAFTIARDGRLVSDRVARGSGERSLDEAAKALVERASPYPAPPSGADDQELYFTVPIRFRR